MALTLSNLQYADQTTTNIKMAVSGWMGLVAPVLQFLYSTAGTDPLSLEIKATLADPNASYTIAPFVPPDVSSAQAKLQLHRAGLLDSVKTAVAQDPEAQLWYDNAVNWQFSNTYVVSLGSQLGLTSAQIVDLFTSAKAIN